MSTDSDTSTPSTTPATAAVALKLPPFYTSSPKFWFVYAEQQFLLRAITADDTKFAHVIASLTEDIATRVLSTIMNPGSSDKYGALKTRLLEEFTLSQSERAAALLDMPGLGDMKPSQLLTRMLSLLPDSEVDNPSFVIRELFLRQLPPDVRAHLTDKSQFALKELAAEADKFFTSAGSRVSAVKTPAAPKSRPAAPDLCFYHSRYGTQAKKCRAPCSYTPGN